MWTSIIVGATVVAQDTDVDQGFWLGGTNWERDAHWIWESTGAELTYQTWGAQQPNNQNGTEHCLSAVKYFDYAWNDAPCDRKIQYVCEKSSRYRAIVTRRRSWRKRLVVGRVGDKEVRSEVVVVVPSVQLSFQIQAYSNVKNTVRQCIYSGWIYLVVFEETMAKLLLFLTLTVLTGIIEGEQTEKSVGDAIGFVLPSYFECGPYSLIGPDSGVLINIANATQCDVMQLYSERSRCVLRSDGSFWLALHHLAKRDEGKYALRAGRRDDSAGCKLEKWTDVIVRGSEWLLWGSWSGCSQSCGTGYRTRSRDCSHPLTCGTDESESMVCEYQPCKEKGTSTFGRISTNLHWSYWSAWSHCSRTCAEGQKTRSRDCLDERSNTLPTEYCKGDNQETDICKDTDCLETSEVVDRQRQSRAISVSVSGVHLYDEINDDDVKSESKVSDRSSVMTIDNTYVFLPKSPNPQSREYGNVAYNNTSKTVATFNYGTSTENNGHQPDNSDILTETTDFFPENVEGPQTSWYKERHKSVDSVGYMIPANERARRNLK
ncbi:ECT-like protein [Mya arenaria]|uniref:ECT-like protein n=1 Tax=Mya arenaria TaxID=6604 RepID=A0ABY7EI89_MYAAR|nr:ECT-like protein [Mya arenaria]